MADVEWDTKEMEKRINEMKGELEKNIKRPIHEVALEILRLSIFQVPHDKGMLQGSGHTEPSSGSSYLVGYNKVYASRLHEHPEYRFQKGRKGKYLEDPIKDNLRLFREYMAKGIKDIIKAR